MELITKVLPYKPTGIVFLGDLQWLGEKSGNTAVTALQKTVRQAVEEKLLIIGMGDYTDFLSPSNRARLLAANLYDTAAAAIDDMAEWLTNDLFHTVLQPTVGQWLGLIEGHHYMALASGETTDMVLARALKSKFLGTSAVITLVFQDASNHRINYRLWVHHGSGNGQTGYYPLARLEKVVAGWEEIDAFAMGHTTKVGGETMDRVRPPRGSRSQELGHREIHLIGTGGYSRTFREGVKQGRVPRGGYAEQRMYNPAVLRSPILRLVPRYAGSGHEVLDRWVEV